MDVCEVINPKKVGFGDMMMGMEMEMESKEKFHGNFSVDGDEGMCVCV